MEYSRWCSLAFLSSKPNASVWRLIVDLREVNKHCPTRKMKMETLRSLQLITKPGDYWVSFDLKDGFYSMAIDPKDREAFIVNLYGYVAAIVLRVIDEVVPKPVCFLKTYGGLHGRSPRPLVINHFSGYIRVHQPFQRWGQKL